MGASELVILALVGLIAGIAGGMLGIGGSIVMIPAMAEILPPDQHLFQAAAMIVNFFVVVPAVMRHQAAGAIDGRTVGRIVPPALLGVVGGVLLSEAGVFAGRGEAYLRGLFGLFLMIVAVIELWRLARRTPEHESDGGDGGLSATRAALIAVPVGLVAGLLGVGGGILAVPLQRRFLRIPIRAAIANSATLIIATSLVGALAKNTAYAMEHGLTSKPFVLAGVLIPTAAIGSLIGSRLTHRLPIPTLKAAFLVVMIVAGLRLLSGVAAAKPWAGHARTITSAQSLRPVSGETARRPAPELPPVILVSDRRR